MSASAIRSQEGSPPQELCEGGGGQAIRGDRGEEAEDGHALAKVDVLRLLQESAVPANCCPVVSLRVAVCEKEREL